MRTDRAHANACAKTTATHGEPNEDVTQAELEKTIMAILWQQEQVGGITAAYDDYRIGARLCMGGLVERYEAQAANLAAATITFLAGIRALNQEETPA